jgi:hypothetical protein
MVAALTAAAFLSAAATADAACYGSSPSSVGYADPVDGDSGLAPEILTVQAAVDGACRYIVDPGVTRSLISGDAVFIFIDTDGNPATGYAAFGGADVAVGTLGETGPDSPPMRGVWDGGTFAFTDPSPVGTPVGNGGFSASVDVLPIPSGVTTHFLVSTTWSNMSIYFDFAPNPGLGTIPLPVTYATAPPAPAPVVAPVQVAKSPAPGTAEDDDACTVPRVRGLSVTSARTRLRGAGCRLEQSARRSYSSTVRRGRVIRATVETHAETSDRVGLVASLGKRPRRARKAGNSILDQLNVLVAAELERAVTR